MIQVVMRVSDIASHLNATWEGDANVEISGAAPLDSAGPKEISFVGNRKAAASAAASQAGCLLVTADFPPGRTVVRVSDPRAAFARVINLLYPQHPVTPRIHSSAVITGPAHIAPSAAIAAHVTIGAGARIGERCNIGPGCVIGAGVSLGDDCHLYA